jgi:hypothetical protein
MCCGKIVKGSVGLLMSILQPADDETIKARRDICRVCPHATRNVEKFPKSNGLTNRSRCQLCSCYIAAKTKVKKEKCPDMRW